MLNFLELVLVLRFLVLDFMDLLGSFFQVFITSFLVEGFNALSEIAIIGLGAFLGMNGFPEFFTNVARETASGERVGSCFRNRWFSHDSLPCSW
jgi:hypothetical protein